MSTDLPPRDLGLGRRGLRQPVDCKRQRTGFRARRGGAVEGRWMSRRVTAPGYGTDPNLLKPAMPWPLTLTR